MIKTTTVEYKHGDVLLEGYYACDEKITANVPAVLVVHDWSGRNDFAEKKAEKLAELGYVGFALDMYGKGKRGETKEEKVALMSPLANNREQLQKRMLAAFEFLITLPHVDPKKIAAIGFCFGGLCALDLARTGADVKAVVSFHGLLNRDEKTPHRPIIAKILALHGFDDPMVSHKDVLAFGDEMTKAKVNWELDLYGNAMHAFTNPKANDPGFGTVYHPQSDTRSWIAMKNFFKEVLG